MTRAILNDYFRSSAAYRVRIALNLKGVEYESRQIDLREGEQKSSSYKALNPQGFVPMLEIDDHRLTQSLAICDYLDSRFPDPPFVPADPNDRAHVLAMALTIACDIHPLNNLRVLKYLSGPLQQDEAKRDKWYAHWIIEGFDALEALAKSRSGGFLFGNLPTLADICLVPQMYNARRFKVPLEAYPTLVRAEASANAIPAFAEAHPDRVEPAQ
jgi:maleylacetoacetate isomerase